MSMHLRQLKAGARFYLLRTMEKYTLLRREIDTPSGTRYVVQREGSSREGRLHHSCHVKPVIRAGVEA